MDQWLEEIRAALPELVVYQQEPMKKHTTFRVGGPADLYVCPKKQELPVILGLAKKKGHAVTVIGNGSNLLVGDKGIRGLVIEVGAQMNAVEVQGNILRAQAGALLSQVAAKAAAAGLGGMEFAAGIPGSIGGAVTMNAGAYGGVIPESPTVSSTGEHIERSRDMVFIQRRIIKDRVQRRNGLIVIAQQKQSLRCLIIHLFLQGIAVYQLLILDICA